MSDQTVLIVEDERETRTLLRFTLSEWTVLEARDGDEGWRMAQQHRPNLVIVDWTMPGLSGPELIDKMRQDPHLRDVPVIMLTGRADGQAAAYRHGVDHFLTKPFSPQAVRAVVQRVMERQERLDGFLQPMMQAVGAPLTDRDLAGMGKALEMIGEIQRYMLRRSAQVIGECDIGADLHPSLIASGDFFDLVPRQDGTLGLVVGDVSGKGPAAALLMVMVRTALRTLARERHSLLEDIQTLNDIMVHDTPTEWFVTMVYLALEPDTGRITYASAGHPPVLICHPDQPVRRLPANGPALGIFPTVQPDIQQTTLEPGDIAIAVTDGVVDALRLEGVQEQEQWLVDQVAAHAARPAHEMAHAVLDAARPSAEEARRDDQTVMVIKRAAAE